jgi:hypothetical protein
LISEVYLSARQLIVLELELVLELGAVIRASTETLTYRKPNNVPFNSTNLAERFPFLAEAAPISLMWRGNLPA